jgi:hypothetical protein
VPSRGPRCDFAVLSVPPAEGFVELGTIVAEGESVEGFRNEIASLVCQAGGDAVIAPQDKSGLHERATVIKLGSLSSSPQTAAPATDGCRFDTQCKGDRICVQGSCVEPEKK